MIILDKPTAEIEALGSVPPEVVGFGLMGSAAIVDGKVVITPIFENKTTSEVTIPFKTTHLFIVDITDAQGGIVHFNQFLPPALPNQTPLIVAAGDGLRINFMVDTIHPPYAGNLKFDPARSPYTFRFEVNSETFLAYAALTIPVLA